jgi:hypothetical protein
MVSGDLLRLMRIGDDGIVGTSERIRVRGRQEPVEAHVVERFA